MLEIGTKVRPDYDALSLKAWGLDEMPDAVVVGHIADLPFNVVHLNLHEDPEGLVEGPSLTSPGWLFTDDELEVL
jgi:hypothetical protein